MQLDIYTGAIVIGIAQALFLSISLFFKPGPLQQANRYLAVLLLCCGLALVVHLLTITGMWQQFLLPYMLLSSVVFAIGPNLYFYVRKMTTLTAVPLYQQLLHYLPLVLNMGYLIVIFMQLDVEFHSINTQKSSWLALLLPICKVLSLAIYSSLSLAHLAKHARRIKQLFSSMQDKSLNWLRNLIFSFMSLVLLFVVLLVFQIDASQLPGDVDTLLSAIIILLIFMTGFYGLHQPEIFSNQLSELPVDTQPTAVNNQDSTQEYQALRIKLDEIIQQYTLFEDHCLDLKMLADALSITPHQLSHFLNHQMHSNFYEFVNLQRTMHAQQALLSSTDNILDIALAAGFSNKATFNSAFKKHTHMTPSQYRKLHAGTQLTK